MPKKKTPVPVQKPDPKVAEEILWKLLDGRDSALTALRCRSVVMCELMDHLEQESNKSEYEAFAAHARDLEAARCEVEKRIDIAYRFLTGEPQKSELEERERVQDGAR